MSDHPAWCVGTGCDAHPDGTHHSVPQLVGLTSLRLAQVPGARVPSVEVRRGDAVLTLPLVEAQSLAAAVDDLLHAAGVGV